MNWTGHILSWNSPAICLIEGKFRIWKTFMLVFGKYDHYGVSFRDLILNAIVSRYSVVYLCLLCGDLVVFLFLFSVHVSGTFDSGDRRCRQRNGLRGAESEAHGPRQPAGASPLGWGHHGAADECSTHSSHRHVPVTQTGLWVASGRGQWWFCGFRPPLEIKWDSKENKICFHFMRLLKCKSVALLIGFSLGKNFSALQSEKQCKDWTTQWMNLVTLVNNVQCYCIIIERNVIMIMSALPIYNEYTVSLLVHWPPGLAQLPVLHHVSLTCLYSWTQVKGCRWKIRACLYVSGSSFWLMLIK